MIAVIDYRLHSLPSTGHRSPATGHCLHRHHCPCRRHYLRNFSWFSGSRARLHKLTLRATFAPRKHKNPFFLAPVEIFAVAQLGLPLVGTASVPHPWFIRVPVFSFSPGAQPLALSFEARFPRRGLGLSAFTLPLFYFSAQHSPRKQKHRTHMCAASLFQISDYRYLISLLTSPLPKTLPAADSIPAPIPTRSALHVLAKSTSRPTPSDCLHSGSAASVPPRTPAAQSPCTPWR